MTATMRRAGFEVDAIDVFCGFGGSSQGIHAAGATVRAAANHNRLSIDCHAANFPDTDHWLADLVDTDASSYVDPAHLPAARFAWFSPSCTHHSQANASKVYDRGLQTAMFEDDDWDEQAYVRSERSRVTMSCVLRYVDRHRPEILVVENVIEVTKWGPNRDGSTFQWWIGELDKLGYQIKPLFLNSMFFPPCPQSRDRIYIVAWRKGNTAPDLDYRPTSFCDSDRCGGVIVDARQTFKRPSPAWLGLTQWGKYLSQYDYRCPQCAHQVHPASWMAVSAIDWTNLGPTLAERDRPLAANTFERIRRAIKKYWHAPPVLLPTPTAVSTVETAHEGKREPRHAGSVLPTLSQRNNTGVASLPLLMQNYGGAEGRDRARHLADPLGTVTVRGTQQSIAVVPNRTNNVPHHGSEPFAPVMTSATQGVVVAAAGNTFEREGYTRARHHTEPLFTLSTTGEHAIAALPVLRGDHEQSNHPGGTLDTVSAGGLHQAIATAMFSKINGGPGDTAWHLVDEPLNTVTARDTHGLVLLPWIDQWRSEPALIHEQLATVTTHMRHSLASIEPFEGDVTDDMLMGVRFRMLEPDPELRRAMAFGDDYVLLGNKSQKTAGLGNAVTPSVASWITQQCLATLGAA